MYPTKITYTKIITALVVILMVFSATVTTYYMFKEEIGKTYMAKFDYGEKTFKNYEKIRKEWRPRIGSTLLVRLFHTTDQKKMKERLSMYFALSFLILCAIYYLISKKAFLFMSLATFVTLAYCCSPAAENTWYPWDMPALIISALALLFIIKGRYLALAITIILGVSFKETVMVIGFIYLFYENMKPLKRVLYSGFTLAGAYILRMLIEYKVQTPMGLDTMSYHINGDPNQITRWQENINLIFSKNMNNPIWANLGLLLIVFFIPTNNLLLKGFKVVLAIFYAGLLFAGSFNEFRVFLEALPMSLFIVYAFLKKETITTKYEPVFKEMESLR